MSLHVPNKELYHNEVVSITKAEVEQSIQTMLNIVDKKRSLEVIDQLIDQLNNFRRHYAGTADPDQPQQQSNTRRGEDRRQQRNH